MKRANGSGSVEVLPDGRARVRAIIDGKRRQVGPIYPNEEAAERALEAWLAERGEGTIIAGSELTLGTYGSAWLDRRELSGSKRREVVRSIASERSVWVRQVLTSKLANKPIAELRPVDVDAFTIELRGRKALHAITHGRGSTKVVTLTETKRPLSRAQQREAIRLVRSVLDAAEREELIERNPATGIEVARGSAAPRDLSEDWLRWPEVLQLLDCEAIDRRDRRAHACAIGLALRLCDLKAIELSRVELDCEVPGPGITVWVQKIQRWHRVPIMPWLAPIIREQVESLPKGARWLFPKDAKKGRHRYAKGYDFGWGEDRESVLGDDGQPLLDNAGAPVIDREPSALERAGVKRRVRFHDLRGTCATHLALGTWGRTWSLTEVQAMLAHSDQKTTERYVRKAVDTLAAAAAATPGGPGLPMRATGTGSEIAEKLEDSGSRARTCDHSVNSRNPDERSRGLSPGHGQRVGNRAHELAIEVIQLAAEGSPHALRRALELAAEVLAETARQSGPATGDQLACASAVESASTTPVGPRRSGRT